MADLADAVADALAEVDAEGAATYRDNAEALRTDLEQLDVTYESGAPGTPHSSFKWVCRKCKAGFQKAGADFKPTTGN